MATKISGVGETQELIKRVQEITHCTVEKAKTALFDCENDLQAAVTHIMENNENLDQWQTSGLSKAKAPKAQIIPQEEKKKLRKTDKNPRRREPRAKTHPKKPFVSENEPQIETWGGEAIKIVNSNAEIALETCAAPVKPIPEEPPKTNGHHKNYIDTILTAEFESKKPPTATITPIKEAALIAPIACSHRMDPRNRQNYRFGDLEMQKMTSNWHISSGPQGHFLLKREPKPVPKPQSTGITTEHLTSMSMLKGQARGFSLEANGMPQKQAPKTSKSSFVNYGEFPKQEALTVAATSVTHLPAIHGNYSSHYFGGSNAQTTPVFSNSAYATTYQSNQGSSGSSDRYFSLQPAMMPQNRMFVPEQQQRSDMRQCYQYNPQLVFLANGYQQPSTEANAAKYGGSSGAASSAFQDQMAYDSGSANATNYGATEGGPAASQKLEQAVYGTYTSGHYMQQYMQHVMPGQANRN